MDFKQGYNRSDWQNFLEDSFLPEDFRQKEEVINFKGNYSKKVTMLGECPSLQLNVFEVNHSSLNDARVGLSKEAFTFIHNYPRYSRALVLFVPEKDNEVYRFSYVEYTPKSNEKGKLAMEITNPRRYSFILGKNAKEHTPRQYLIERRTVKDAEDLKSRFSVEVLTKEFYDRLFKWYKWALDIVCFPEGCGKNTKLTEKNNEMQLIRLITRLIFVWFMKQKKLIPEWIFDNKNELPKILSDFSQNSEKKGSYYNAILQNLFFATLNREILDEKGNPNRHFTDHDNDPINSDYAISYKYRDNKEKSFFKETHEKIVERFKEVPFLNGGLFECLDSYIADGKDKKHGTKYYIDGFSREEKRRAFLPDCLFWSNNLEHEGIINILSQYNFTIEENTPSDIEVALDPELLGKVFENLLGYIDQDTHKFARNASGSFYTPREIVTYMVDESLITYIKTKIPALDEDEIRSLFIENFSNYNNAIISNKLKICTCLKNIKILDPACGSGAFPMGILNRMTYLLQKLEGINTSEEIYKLKLYLIENCIYGIDIQPIAVQIAKLRFFISLICEQERNDKIKENYGIKPLPNLETKFVAANTLCGLSEDNRDTLDLKDEKLSKMKNDLWDIRKSYFYAKDSKEKKLLQRDDEQERNEIMVYLIKKGSKPNQEYIAQLEKEIVVLQQEWIIVSNENFIKEKELQNDFDFGIRQTSKSLFQTDKNKPKRDAINREIKRLMAEISREQSKEKRLESFDKAIENLASWNPYDQNGTSLFFDNVWMFGVEKGFDIVIGNPPYVSTKGITTEDKKYFEKEYGFADDTYSHFFFKGCSLLTKEGILTFISPKTYWTIQTKKNLRELLLSKKIIYIFDTANPFKTAMVDTCITSIQNTEVSEKIIRFFDGSKDFNSPEKYTISQSVYLNAQNIVIFKPTQENLKIYNLYNKKVKELYLKWWDKISTSKNIEKNKKELEEYRNSLKPGDIALLGCLTEGGQGLATANNGKYIAVRKSSKWAKNIIKSRPKKLADAIKSYKIKIPEMSKFSNTVEYLKILNEKQIAILFDNLKEKYGRDIFGQGYLYRLIDDNEIANVDKLTDDEKANGINRTKKYYVPYDKGDKDGNRWYLETPFAIAWSKENVGYLKTNSGKKGEGMPVVRNPQYYFKEGFCWTDVNSTYLKARIKKIGIFDVLSMSLFTKTIIPDWYYVSIINSKVISFYVNNFINNTSHFQINDARQLPIIIPTNNQLKELGMLFNSAYMIKKAEFSNQLSTNTVKEKINIIQKKIDNLVKYLYNLV